MVCVALGRDVSLYLCVSVRAYSFHNERSKAERIANMFSAYTCTGHVFSTSLAVVSQRSVYPYSGCIAADQSPRQSLNRCTGTATEKEKQSSLPMSMLGHLKRYANLCQKRRSTSDDLKRRFACMDIASDKLNTQSSLSHEAGRGEGEVHFIEYPI